MIIPLPKWYREAEKKLQDTIDDLCREHNVNWQLVHDSLTINEAIEAICSALAVLEEYKEKSVPEVEKLKRLMEGVPDSSSDGKVTKSEKAILKMRELHQEHSSTRKLRKRVMAILQKAEKPITSRALFLQLFGRPLPKDNFYHRDSDYNRMLKALRDLKMLGTVKAEKQPLQHALYYSIRQDQKIPSVENGREDYR